jgi:ribose-phosphate pyrophosphokinase
MTSLIHPVKIFGGSASLDLTQAICEFYGTLPGELAVSRFSDGEFQPNFMESVRGCDVFIVQSTYPNSDNLMELLMAIDAAKRASANYITAVLPYYGFARQDRKDKPRVSIASKLVADLLSTAGANRVMTMELHAPQIQGFFNVPVDHLESSIIFVPYIKTLSQENLVIAAPDVGASNRIREVAKLLNLPMVICDKERKRANEIANMTVIGDVEGKDVVLIDDIIDTGGTLCMHKVPPVSIISSINTTSLPSTSPITVILAISLARLRSLSQITIGKFNNLATSLIRLEAPTSGAAITKFSWLNVLM